MHNSAVECVGAFSGLLDDIVEEHRSLSSSTVMKVWMKTRRRRRGREKEREEKNDEC